MKTKILFLFLSFTCLSFGQNYKLFDESSKKLFATHPDMENTYSLSFDSVLMNEGDSIYYNFFRIDDFNFISYDCDFWIGPECYKQNIPVWIGTKIDFNNLNSYNFYPNNGDTIKFLFNPVPGDSNIFYQDDSQKFSLTFEGSDTITSLNYADSARFFKISHTDLNGNVINSQLNGHDIVIGNNLGLIHFFQVDSFPQTLKPLFLIGNGLPDIGITKITNEMLYDYQPGDEIQYRESYHNSMAPPGWNYIGYRKHVVLNRTETSDSLIYLMEETLFYEDSSLYEVNTISKSYNRFQTIAQVPFEVFDGSFKQFNKADYCDLKLWTYSIEAENNLGYCDIDNVWGNIDNAGPAPVYETKKVLGLGDYEYLSINYNGGIQYYSRTQREIIYFKKDDVLCGEEIIVGTEEFVDNMEIINIFPNPADDYLAIQISKGYENSDVNFELRDIFGMLILKKEIYKIHERIEISELGPGLYFYIIRKDNRVYQTDKLIVY